MCILLVYFCLHCWKCTVQKTKYNSHIYQWLCHMRQRNISKHFVLPATVGHTATLQYATELSAKYSNHIYEYISVCIMWYKGTSVYIWYCQLQQVTQEPGNMLHSYRQHTAAIYIYVGCLKSIRPWIFPRTVVMLGRRHCAQWKETA